MVEPSRFSQPLPVSWTNSLPSGVLIFLNRNSEALNEWLKLPETVALKLLELSQDDTLGLGPRSLAWVPDQHQQSGKTIHLGFRISKKMSVEDAVAEARNSCRSVQIAYENGEAFQLVSGSEVELKVSTVRSASSPRVSTVTGEEDGFSFVLVSEQIDGGQCAQVFLVHGGQLSYLGIQILPIELADMQRALHLLREYPALSTRDAVHAAVMFEAEIDTIATFDRDFATVVGIQLYPL